MVFPSLTYPPDIQFHVSLIARGVVRDFSGTAFGTCDLMSGVVRWVALTNAVVVVVSRRSIMP